MKGAHLRALDPIPKEAHDDPLGWSEKHIESLAPASVKELEWSLYFGSEEARRNTAKDLLAMKGITTKPKDAAPVQQAVILNLGLPLAPNGVPVLPFSNAQAAPSAPLDTATADAHTDTKAPATDPKGKQ